MNYDLNKIIESKRRYREQLAARPIAEKLAMLDQLRERTLEIRASRTVAAPRAGLSQTRARPPSRG
jgi:hypothetical protein